MTGTFEDVRNCVLESENFSNAYKKKIVGRLNTYAKKTNRTLLSIPADIHIFEKEFGKGRVDPIPAGYKSKGQVNTAASEIRTALREYLSSKDTRPGTEFPASEKVEAEWANLRSALAPHLNNKKLIISIDVLIAKCCQSQILPCDVTHEFLMRKIRESLTAGEYRSIQTSWKLIQLHADKISIHTTLPEHLPFSSLAKTRNVCVRLPLPPLLSQRWEEWSRNKRSPLHYGVVERLSVDGLSQETFISYYDSLTYYHTCLVELGHIGRDQDPDISDIIKDPYIAEVVAMETQGKFPWDKLGRNTLFNYTIKFLQIGSELDCDTGAIKKKIKESRLFYNVHEMSRNRRSWCQQLMADEHRAKALYTLPRNTYAKAKTLMEKYDSLSQHEKNVAIKASIAACAFAILTSLPVRIGTLIELKHFGEGANIFPLTKGKDLLVNTTPEMVKNGYAHERVSLPPKPGGNPKEIVKWFIECVHPILVRHHITKIRPNHDLLFGGIKKDRLRDAIRDYSIENGIDMTPHLFRHGVATLLANEENPNMEAIAAILGISVHTVMKNYAFIDQARLHKKGQEMILRTQRSALLLENRK